MVFYLMNYKDTCSHFVTVQLCFYVATKHFFMSKFHHIRLYFLPLLENPRLVQSYFGSTLSYRSEWYALA